MGRSLKARELGHFFGNGGDDLDASGTIANYPHALVGEVVRSGPFPGDGLFRREDGKRNPGLPGMVHLSLKLPDARNVGIICLGQKAHRGHQVAGSQAITHRTFHFPQIVGFVVVGGFELRIELHMFPQMVSVDHMAQVGQDLRLLDVVIFPVVVDQIFFVPAEAVYLQTP